MNQKIILTIAFLIGALGIGVGVYFWHQSELDKQAIQHEKELLQTQMENQKQAQDGAISGDSQDQTKPSQENDVADVENDWTTYKNDKLGISFEHPAEWGEVIRKEGFDATKGEYEYFGFSLYEIYLGGFHSDYQMPERGGSLMDYKGFVPNKSIGLKYVDSGEVIWSRDKYQVSSSGNCAYTIDKYWFPTITDSGLAYHAVCNLDRDFMTGFNFAHGGNMNPITIDPEVFIKVIESVKIY